MQRLAGLPIVAAEDLIVPSLVLAELDYWCARRLSADAWLIFLDDVLAGAYRVEPLTTIDMTRCRELQDRYQHL